MCVEQHSEHGGGESDGRTLLKPDTTRHRLCTKTTKQNQTQTNKLTARSGAKPTCSRNCTYLALMAPGWAAASMDSRADTSRMGCTESARVSFSSSGFSSLLLSTFPAPTDCVAPEPSVSVSIAEADVSLSCFCGPPRCRPPGCCFFSACCCSCSVA